MKIAMVNNFFLPRPSGSAHFAHGLAQQLVKRGDEVLVVSASYGDAPSEEVIEGYRVVRLPSWSPPRSKLSFNYEIAFTASPRNIRRLFRLLDDFAPDVLHQHGQFFDLTVASAVWARRRHVPSVLTVHTALIHTSPLFRALLWAGDELVIRPSLAIGRPTVVIIDKFTGSYIRNRYRLPKRRLAQIPIGIDPERFSNVDGSALRDELGLGDRPVVLSIGHVIPLRDRHALVRALPRLIELVPDVVVLVVGRVFDDSFLRIADELGVRDRLVVTGEVPKDAVPKYVAVADVEGHDFQNYGLGTASLEVMAAGVPVVSVAYTDSFPGIRLRSWEDLVLVPLDDPDALAEAIARLITDRPLACQLGAKQQRFIRENFSLQAISEQYRDLYVSLGRIGGS